MTNRLFYIDDIPKMRLITDRVGPSTLIARMRNTFARPMTSILTKPASEDIAYMNQRMPVIFEDPVEWVMTPGDPKPLLRKAMERMAVDIAPPEKPITYDFE